MNSNNLRRGVSSNGSNFFNYEKDTNYDIGNQRNTNSLSNFRERKTPLPLINNANNILNNYNQFENNYNDQTKPILNERVMVSSRHSSSRDNLSNNNYNKISNGFDNDMIYQEINNLKRLVKNSLENHTELQTKIIEYNKIINEQENIIRLNNIKINEHDSKLTEILITFNNYLQLNEKSNKIINDLTAKYEDVVKKSDLTDLKSTVYNFNRNNETKAMQNTNKIEELFMKTTEISKEQEIFQKYTLEKLKNYQNEAMDNRLQQQQQLIKLEESRENKLNQQIDQIKGLIKITEKNLANESDHKKNMIDNLKQEIMQVFGRHDEKIINLEKTHLETEKKLVGFNKDYIETFQELISKHNQKYDIELKSLRSLIDNKTSDINSKLEENLKQIDQTVEEIKNFNQESKSWLSQLNLYIKENIDNFEKKYSTSTIELDTLKEKTEHLSSTLNKFMKENLSFIDTKIDKDLTLLENRFYKRCNEINASLQILEGNIDKKFYDTKEKIDMINKQVTEISLGFINATNKTSDNKDSSDKQQNKTNVIDAIDLVILEKKIDDKLILVKNDLEEYEKKLIILMNLHIDGIKIKLNEEQKNLVNDISEKLESKINLLKKDVETKIKEEDLIKEGRMQEYVVESSERIKKNLETRINNIQGEIEKLNIKATFLDAPK